MSRLDPPFVRWQGRGKDCSTPSSTPIMEGPGANFEEKHEPASDIDTVVHCGGPIDPADRPGPADGRHRQ